MSIDRRRFLIACALSSAQAASAWGGAAAAEEKGKAPPATGGRTDLLGDPLPPGALLRLGTTRLRHQDYASAVAFSPDGKRLASAGYDDVIRVWDVAGGTQIKAIETDPGFLNGLAYSPDGTLLATGNNDIVRLHDAVTGALLGSLQGDKGEPIHTLAFAPGGRLLATGTVTYARAIYLWSLPQAGEGKELRRLGGQYGEVRSVAFAPDGRTLATCGQRGTDFIHTHVSLWEVGTGKEVWTAKGPNGVTSVAFAPDGQTVAAAGFAEPIRLYEAATGKPVPVADEQAQVLTFAPDGKALALGCQDGTVRLWEPSSGKQLLKLRRHGSVVTAVAFSRDGKMLASSSRDGSLALSDVATGKDLHPYPGHKYHVQSVAFAPDGKALVSRGGDHTVRLWDTATGRERYRLDLASPADYALQEAPYRLENNNLYLFTSVVDYVQPALDHSLAQRVAYSSDGKLLAAPGLRRSVHVWEAATGKPLLELPGHSQPVRCVAFAPDGKVLASADRDGIILLRDAATGRPRRQLEWPQPAGRSRQQAYVLAFSPDGKTVAAACSNRAIRLWDTASGQLRKELPYWGDSLAFLPDGTTLAALELGRDADGTIHLLDAPTGTDLATLRGHRGRVQSLALSADGKLLASVGDTDRTVRVWELATRQQVLCFEGHSNAVLAVAFARDGKTLASASRDTTLLLWDLLAPPGAAPAGAPQLGTEELDDLWRRLAAGDAVRAYQAMCRLVAAPDDAVAWFRNHLRPAPEDKRDEVTRLVADLDSDQFAVREAAARQLRARGKPAEPLLREALGRPASPEVRRQLEALLEAVKRAQPDPEALRRARAVLALERIGSEPARQLLRALGRGAPAAEQTQDARAALARLEQGTKGR